MRSLLIALPLLVPAAAHAQPIHGAAPTPPITLTPASPTRQTAPHPPTPPPQTVPPPTVFPLPPLMTPPVGGLTSGFPGFFSHDAFAASRTKPFRRHGPIVAPFYGGFVPGYAVADESIDRARPAAPTAEPEGALRLSVTPDTAQVFVDGFYVATIEDLGARQELALEPGPHRIEIRAPAYRTLTFDVRIAPREMVTYRGSLEPARPAATPPPTAPPPATGRAAGPMYVIPNCYMGNVPPRASRLPPGCDVTQVQVLGPR